MTAQTGFEESDKTSESSLESSLKSSDGMIQAVNVRSVSLVILATIATLVLSTGRRPFYCPWWWPC
jgi:hypothetical protein